MIFQDPLSALNPLMTVGRQIIGVMEAHGWGTHSTRRARALDLTASATRILPEFLDSDCYRELRRSGGSTPGAGESSSGR